MDQDQNKGPGYAQGYAEGKDLGMDVGKALAAFMFNASKHNGDLAVNMLKPRLDKAGVNFTGAIPRDMVNEMIRTVAEMSFSVGFDAMFRQEHMGLKNIDDLKKFLDEHYKSF